MSMDEFDLQVAWLGAQPSPFGGGGASAAQELVPEEPATATTEGEDELTLPEPFYFDVDAHMAQEEGKI